MKQVLSHNIRILRTRMGLSIWKVGKASGIHKHTIKNIEYGLSLPSSDVLLRLCDFYGVTDIRLFLTEKIN